jgi:hypothetical protein
MHVPVSEGLENDEEKNAKIVSLRERTKKQRQLLAS